MGNVLAAHGRIEQCSQEILVKRLVSILQHHFFRPTITSCEIDIDTAHNNFATTLWDACSVQKECI